MSPRQRFGRRGRTLSRAGARRAVAGRGRYTDDITLPLMLHAAFLRSPHAHARISAIDVVDARCQPGVAMVMTGAELASAKIDVGEPVDPTAQVVVIPFPAVKPGQNVRIRISETYTAPASYRLEGDELVFDRSLGRARNAIVLPEG